MARPADQPSDAGAQPAWAPAESAVAPMKASVAPVVAPAQPVQAPTISPTLEDAEHSGAEAEEEDEMMLEENPEAEGETGGDAFAKLPENATEEEQYEALTQQSLNADGTPKRPMNAFMIWGRRRRPQLADAHPMLRTGDISKIMSDEWSSMAKEEKEHYQNMAKRLKDAFNARWPTYVYKRRPNNSRRKRKKVTEGSGPEPRGSEASRGIQKRGSFSSVGTITNITTFSSRPSTARSHSGQSAGTDSPPTTGGSRVSAGHIPTMGSQSGTPSVVQGAYGGYARPDSSGPSSWSWSSGSAVQHELPVPASTSAPSAPAMRRQSSHHSMTGMAANGPQFKHEDEEEVIYRSGNSPDTEHMWHGNVPRGLNITDFQPQQRGDFNITDFQPRDNVSNDPNWISHFQMGSSYGMSGAHGTSSQRSSYSSATGQSMPPLPGFPSGSRGSFSSLNAIHNFGASASSPQERFPASSAAPTASPSIESNRGNYTYNSSMNGSFAASSSGSSVTPPADQSRSNYFNGSNLQPGNVSTQVGQSRGSLPSVLSFPQQGRPEERPGGGYWSPHGEQPR